MAKTVKLTKAPATKTAAKKLTPAKKSAAPKKVTPLKKVVAPKKVVAAKKAAVPVVVRPLLKKYVLYVDSCYFFPTSTTEGYADDYQAGRYSTTAGGTLQAPIILPVGSKINSITVYYKNTAEEEMQVNIVRKSISHWASTEEYLVSYEGLPPGTGVAPDYFAATLINHFADAGKIADKYLYYIMISGTGKISDTQTQNVRGMRIDYSYAY